jgi:hypothetical protein
MTFKNQKEMFNWIWENRPHVSELSGKPLVDKGHFMWHWQFAHILPKGSYPKYKLNSDNVMLVTSEEHCEQEDYKIFLGKQKELRRKYYEEFYGKEFEDDQD